MISAFRSIDPMTHVTHALHREGRGWMETNCYVDVWLELLHALGLDPVAPLAFTLVIDFEGDQWTFYKYSLAELWSMYGLDTQELNVWRGPLECTVEQVRRGRVVLMETDAFYLPDTAATNYHRDHLNKTSIGVQEIDVEARRLRYFHGPGYYELSGDDFIGAFRVGEPAGSYLNPYVEYVKLDRMVRPAEPELTALAVGQLRDNLARRPRVNPFIPFRKKFAADLEWLRAEPASFHAYAFATLRQFGSCYDVAAVFLRWLRDRGEGGLEPAALELDNLSGSAKVLQLKLARFANNKKPFDATEILDVMEKSWDTAMAALVARYG
jgi:hypothetical protein